MLHLFEDREFVRRLWTLALPIFGQQFIQQALGAVDVLMVGQLNETAVAAVGIADQLFFLLVLYLFGVASGSQVFAAQAWGKGDIPRIHRVMGLGLILGLAGAAVFMTAAIVIPERVMGVYSEDPAVIALSTTYLKIVGWSYLGTTVTMVLGSVMRSTENARPPMIASLIALGLNSIFNYVLIFGALGFPALGVEGAAYATCAARILEAILLLGWAYYARLPVAARWSQLWGQSRSFVRSFLRTAAPVLFTEIAWSLGVTTYYAFYGRIGTESVAAVGVATSIERLAFVVFIGLGGAASVMIGNRIGANEDDKAIAYAWRLMALQFGLGIFVGAVIFAFSGMIPSFYNISPQAAENLRTILMIMGCMISIKAVNLMNFIGIVRAGGDTRVGMWMDIGPMWLIGVPLAWFAAFALGWPVAWVYLLTMSEELVKLIVSVWRIRSGRWIHHLEEI